MRTDDSAIRKTATWLFVLPIFTGGIAQYSARVEAIGLAVLAFATIVVLQKQVSRVAVTRIFSTAATLTLLVCAFLAFRPWPSYGSIHSYNTQAFIFVVTYSAVAIFAVLFFEERQFESVVWRAATLALWVGVISCLVSRITHQLILVNPADSGLRMQGTLSEPSAWAPVIPLVLLLAARRRSRLYIILALLGAALLDSPTCILVLLIAVPLYYLLTGSLRHRVPALLALAVALPAAILFVQSTNPDHYLESHDAAVVALGRLISGIRNVETDGQLGANDRFASTTVVINEVRANGLMHIGAGPGADNTYFPAKYPATGPQYRPNSLWASVLFDFGEGGVAIVAILMLIAFWRLQRYPVMAAILLPFLIASLLNSAEGSFEYAFVVLGIMLFTFHWVDTPMAISSYAETRGSAYPSLTPNSD